MTACVWPSRWRTTGPSVLGTAGFCLPTGCLILNRCTCCLVPSGLGILPSPAISPASAPLSTTSHFLTALFWCMYICAHVCRLRSRRSCIIMVVSAVPPAHHFTRMLASDIDPSRTSFHPLSLADTHVDKQSVYFLYWTSGGSGLKRWPY